VLEASCLDQDIQSLGVFHHLMGKDFSTYTVYSTKNQRITTFRCSIRSLYHRHCMGGHSQKFGGNLGSLDPTEMLSCSKVSQEKQQQKILVSQDRFCMQDTSHLKMKLSCNHHILRQFFE